MAKLQKIIPFLWFDNQAEEAAGLYASIFPNAKLESVKRLGEAVKIVVFSLDGQQFRAMDAGPMFQVNASISFFVVCETESEIDAAWNRLMEGGKVMIPLGKYAWSEKYGWLEDRFGVSWQIFLGKLADTGGLKFSPSLLFTGDQSGRAEEAVHFYTSVFSPSSISGILRYEAGEEGREGSVKHAQFDLCGQTFMAGDDPLGSPFAFNEGLSFVVDCEDQREVDYFWDSLLAGGGQEDMCGWLKDRFGVSWQVIPRELPELLANPDPEKAQRASAAMMQMRKIELDKLR